MRRTRYSSQSKGTLLEIGKRVRVVFRTISLVLFLQLVLGSEP